MKNLISALVAGAAASLALAGLATGTAHVKHQFGATLSPSAEALVPKGASRAGGTIIGSYTGNATGAVLTFKLSFSALTGAATAAHVHMGRPGVAGPVIVPLCGPCKNGQTGTVKIGKSVIAALAAGKAYVNVHTAKNAAGEIRGQVNVFG
jgi:hypothetical protein